MATEQATFIGKTDDFEYIENLVVELLNKSINLPKLEPNSDLLLNTHKSDKLTN